MTDILPSDISDGGDRPSVSAPKRREIDQIRLYTKSPVEVRLYLSPNPRYLSPWAKHPQMSDRVVLSVLRLEGALALDDGVYDLRFSPRKERPSACITIIAGV